MIFLKTTNNEVWRPRLYSCVKILLWQKCYKRRNSWCCGSHGLYLIPSFKWHIKPGVNRLVTEDGLLLSFVQFEYLSMKNGTLVMEVILNNKWNLLFIFVQELCICTCILWCKHVLCCPVKLKPPGFSHIFIGTSQIL